MSKLRAPGLGPIVGHTSEQSCRIWIRANPETDNQSHPDARQRSVGVVGIFSVDGEDVAEHQFEAYYFRLRREFDRSGSIDLGKDTPTQDNPSPLRSDALYEVRVGVLVLDDPTDDDEEFDSGDLIDRLPRASAWYEDLKSLPDKKSLACFRTFPSNVAEAGRFSFLLGSCRYPGLLWKVRHSDRIFKPMAEQVEADEPPRFQLMVGDQIYADMFNRYMPLGRADSFAEFRERYVTAYSSPNIRRLMRNLPTYMILDDHEIEDNWSQDRLKRNAKYQLFTIAIDAYLSYQWSHGPRTHGKRLYYNFDYADYPFFVLDTRTQRFIEGERGDLSKNHMLGRPTHEGAPPGQLQRLTDWLARQQDTRGNVPKFIVTSSVFVPNRMSTRQGEDSDVDREDSDSWPGFPQTRAAILRCIVENNIQNVVFLSGDIHCTNVAELSFSGNPEAEAIKLYSVTSSAFYWPFPFADGEPSDYVHDSEHLDQKDSFCITLSDEREVVMDYKASNFTQDDNFCRLTLDPDAHTLQVQVYDTDGDLVREETGDGGSQDLRKTFNLAEW